jgi:hypothetical protein
MSHSPAEEALAHRLLDASLAQRAWTHAGHVTAAHVLVTRLGHRRALAAIRSAIPCLNDAHGVENSDTDGYHDTITIWFAAAVADAVDRGLGVPETIAALPAAAPLAFWSRHVLLSPAARRGWIAPDVAVPAFAIELPDPHGRREGDAAAARPAAPSPGG